MYIYIYIYIYVYIYIFIYNHNYLSLGCSKFIHICKMKYFPRKACIEHGTHEHARFFTFFPKLFAMLLF